MCVGDRRRSSTIDVTSESRLELKSKFSAKLKNHLGHIHRHQVSITIIAQALF